MCKTFWLWCLRGSRSGRIRCNKLLLLLLTTIDEGAARSAVSPHDTELTLACGVTSWLALLVANMLLTLLLLAHTATATATAAAIVTTAATSLRLRVCTLYSLGTGVVVSGGRIRAALSKRCLPHPALDASRQGGEL
jgi:hypothetical protein